ncbi:hypothetical protein RND71_040823 [Anisodus tanguticus]|uniref:Uncharacterized protein n=1 Tax=Anisodus tanguticus TaxID=243964 RepID=A0AAE1QU37_9SOLA|nr:hypothetical protein RND71_040823 [Anisodus tanguticus]
MAVSKIVVSMLLAIFAMTFFTVQAQAPAPTSDGVSVDQGIAYVLMQVALVLTYLIHPMESSSYNFF